MKSIDPPKILHIAQYRQYRSSQNTARNLIQAVRIPRKYYVPLNTSNIHTRKCCTLTSKRSTESLENTVHYLIQPVSIPQLYCLSPSIKSFDPRKYCVSLKISSIDPLKSLRIKIGSIHTQTYSV